MINENGRNLLAEDRVKGVDFIRLHKDFSVTEEGQILNESIRFARYKPEEISKNEWVKISGADVQNYEHMRLTYGVLRQFLLHSSEAYTPEEVNLLLLSAIVHDLAEAKVGDKSLDQKTSADEKAESNVFADFVLNYVSEKIKGVDLNQVHEILFNKEYKLHSFFNAVERVGYIRTALIAWRRRGLEEGAYLENFDWLTSNCFGNNIVILIQYAEKFPQVAEYLEANSDLIGQAFEGICKECFEKYEKGEEREAQRGKFEAAKKGFEGWRKVKEGMAQS